MNKEEHRESARKYMKRHRKKLRKRVLGLFGGKCFLCGVEEKRNRIRSNLNFHKKDGQPHGGKAWLLALKTPKEFVLLCYPCHKGVHFCMERLNMTWEDVKSKFNGG